MAIEATPQAATTPRMPFTPKTDAAPLVSAGGGRVTEALAELLAEGAPDPEALPLAEAEEVPLLVDVAAGAARRRKSCVRRR